MNKAIFEVLEKLEKQSSLEKSRQVNVSSDERMLAITKETGELLNMLIRLKNAKNMLEVGMSVGYSTIWCAEAIIENNGKIITIEQNAKKIQRAKENFQNANVSEHIAIQEGLAMQILQELSLNEDYKVFFDFVLIDADKENVIEYFDMILPMVSVGGVIVTDNMLYPEKYRESMKEYSSHIQAIQNVRTITSPIGNGEEITIKLR
ncbi:O-methyltransferase [Nitrosopumilus maritimus]|uniref:O-methyltransferase family 3 n=1 Tax=Nitrosopumilus maritimus (strain SCM1) TaxID=436308 RepID=A9A4G2_NITMS|nr:O-methyltransferase [Nitrosopumilus maritimus]ABX12651.1 O-methyltransferase family 3 [Nitrosopumilus maritimus SCM1]